jgi:hypothetical protein
MGSRQEAVELNGHTPSHTMMAVSMLAQIVGVDDPFVRPLRLPHPADPQWVCRSYRLRVIEPATIYDITLSLAEPIPPVNSGVQLVSFLVS